MASKIYTIVYTQKVLLWVNEQGFKVTEIYEEFFVNEKSQLHQVIQILLKIKEKYLRNHDIFYIYGLRIYPIWRLYFIKNNLFEC